MILVGLCCIQANPSNRSAINKVIETFEGNLESLQIPLEPFLSSPSRTPIMSSTIQISQENESCEVKSMYGGTLMDCEIGPRISQFIGLDTELSKTKTKKK
ncbi:unnamed protein product [Camellia sinensis]